MRLRDEANYISTGIFDLKYGLMVFVGRELENFHLAGNWIDINLPSRLFKRASFIACIFVMKLKHWTENGETFSYPNLKDNELLEKSCSIWTFVSKHFE